MAPEALHRDRLLEVDDALAATSRWLAGVVAVLLVVGAVVVSPFALLPLTSALFVLVQPAVSRTNRTSPELVDLAATLTHGVVLAATAALTGGFTSPLVPVVVLALMLGVVRQPPRSAAIIALSYVLLLVVACLWSGHLRSASDAVAGASWAVVMLGVAAIASVVVGVEGVHRSRAVLDPLTGLLNRVGLEGRFEEVRQQAALTGAPVSVVIADLDHFKQVNDLHGHQAGDAVLKAAAYAMRKTLRRFDLLYRLGGEEFLLLLPGLDLDEAADMASRLREALAADDLAGVRVTASLGVAATTADGTTFADLYEQADRALYEAKAAGRDRVVIADPRVPVAVGSA